MEDDYGSRSSRRNMNVIMIATIFIVGIIYFLTTDQPVVQCAIEDETLKLTGLESLEYNIPLDGIFAVEYVEKIDYGTPVEGEDDTRYRSGIWNNELYGDYYLYINTDNTANIKIDTQDGIYVFNVESDAETESFCEALVQYLLDGGYL